MKKILFWALLCLFTFVITFTSCERNNPYQDDKIEDIKSDEEVNYCEVFVKIDDYYYTDDFKITYEGGYGLYEGSYLVPQGTSFKVQWNMKYESKDPWLPCKATFDVGSAKTLKVLISGEKAKIVNEF